MIIQNKIKKKSVNKNQYNFFMMQSTLSQNRSIAFYIHTFLVFYKFLTGFNWLYHAKTGLNRFITCSNRLFMTLCFLTGLNRLKQDWTGYYHVQTGFSLHKTCYIRIYPE